MLSHKNTAFMLDHLLDLASSIKLLRSISMHNWAHSRLDAKGQPAITLIAPPESVYLKSIKSLKTEPHPSLVALGVSDRAPAEEEFETTACGCRFDKTLPAVLTDIWTYQQLRWINGCAETIAEYDEVSCLPRERRCLDPFGGTDCSPACLACPLFHDWCYSRHAKPRIRPPSAIGGSMSEDPTGQMSCASSLPAPSTWSSFTTCK